MIPARLRPPGFRPPFMIFEWAAGHQGGTAPAQSGSMHRRTDLPLLVL